MFPPPCFTVGMVFFGCNSAFFLLQTRQVEFLPKSYILVSSDHMTFSQSSSGSSKCSLANFRWAWTCTGLSRGTRLALQDLSPWRRSVLLIVAFVTLVPALCRSFTRSPRVVLGFLLTVLVQFSSSLPVALLSSVACELAPLRIVLLCVFLYLFLFFLLLF